MSDIVLAVLGVALIGWVFVDALMTTVSVGSKSGWLTGALSRALWRLFRWAHRVRVLPSLLVPAGVLMLATTVLVWVSLLWTGTTLVLLSGDPAVADATTGAPAGVAQVAYYAGFTVFTLGVGDYVATSDGWKLYTAAMSFAGLVLVTLAITYLLSVVSAEVSRRSLAVHVHALGRTPAEVVLGGWTGSQFSSPFQQHLVSLASEVATLAEQQLAYPVLQYFHTGTRATAAPVALAVLDDALLLLATAVPEELRPPGSATGPLRYAVERHMAEATDGSGPDRRLDPPPTPDRSLLVTGGLPMTADEQFLAGVEQAAQRRSRLHRLVVSAGWTWEQQEHSGP